MSILPVLDRQLLIRKASEDARQYVYRVIKTCILELLLPPNRKLNEATMAETLQVSRTPVHDTFFKLSRENLVDIYPKRGAYVAKISPCHLEQAVWTHTQLGCSMLNTIFSKTIDGSRLSFNPSKSDEVTYRQAMNHSQLLPLRHLLRQMDDALFEKKPASVAHMITEYYHQLYLLAGDTDLIWDSLQKIDVDMRRILYLASKNPVIIKGFHYELAELTDALAEKKSDLAYRILENHFSRLLLLAEPLKEQKPDYFIQASGKYYMEHST